MMNHARLDVALQSVAHAARAHDIARAYAADRIQGRDANDRPARLDTHADVRRMLDEMDRLALGGRAIAHLAYVTMERGNNPDLVDFLTPVAKVFCSKAGIRAAELGIQVLGGYGYLREYRLEQTYRDARITSIYEGTNGIHARMLATRLLRLPAADAFDAFVAGEDDADGSGEILLSLQRWRHARTALADTNDPTPGAHDFMRLTEETLLQCLWRRFKIAASDHADRARINRVGDNGIACATLSASAHGANIGF